MSQWYRCVRCGADARNRKERRAHCCCTYEEQVDFQCPGHSMKRDHCAGTCLECGWGGCLCTQRHCCCEIPQGRRLPYEQRPHVWMHQFYTISKETV